VHRFKGLVAELHCNACRCNHRHKRVCVLLAQIAVLAFNIGEAIA
jgi:hypothetical protein